ncbi:MAG: hypothetical protein RMJ98_07580 [Myxococcales bacterium]|nr:hypothetical protein [Polyangiaceae bacterium]MDW8249146.1 hypothetical protein [Myxococcales bacterium]
MVHLPDDPEAALARKIQLIRGPPRLPDSSSADPLVAGSLRAVGPRGAVSAEPGLVDDPEGIHHGVSLGRAGEGGQVGIVLLAGGDGVVPGHRVLSEEAAAVVGDPGAAPPSDIHVA